VLSISGKAGSVSDDATFEAGKGKPGIWLKQVVDGAVQSTLVPASGKVCDILKPAQEIVDDPRVATCRAENAPPPPQPTPSRSGGDEGAEPEPEGAGSGNRTLDVAGIAAGERPRLKD
jgi:hypothetical protein